MPSLHIEAPTDSQLVYLKRLCEERGIEPHEIVVGKQGRCVRVYRRDPVAHEPGAVGVGRSRLLGGKRAVLTRMAHSRFAGIAARFVPVCYRCGREIADGEPRAIVRQRFAVCASCLYAESRRDRHEDTEADREAEVTWERRYGGTPDAAA